MVAAHPAARIGSYPPFAEREFRVMVTLETADAAEVAAAFEQLAARLGARVMRRDEPHRVGT